MQDEIWVYHKDKPEEIGLIIEVDFGQDFSNPEPIMVQWSEYASWHNLNDLIKAPEA